MQKKIPRKASQKGNAVKTKILIAKLTTKTIDVTEATPIQLDWLVAKCEGYDCAISMSGEVVINRENIVDYFNPSTSWGWGGPIIEREGIATRRVDALNDDEVDEDMHHWWCAAYSRKTLNGFQGVKDDVDLHWGSTLLLAAMRLLVVSKLGRSVEVPEDLN
jgi:hypothetical protein